jgi:hypothetical protein
MFARPRPKKSLLPPPPKRRKTAYAIEEISFDNDARSDYLTGFHKRKLQRVKHAQEEAAKQARIEKVEVRKQVRPSHTLHRPLGWWAWDRMGLTDLCRCVRAENEMWKSTSSTSTRY